MMTLKEFRDLLNLYGPEYDDWELKLWDYKNQKELDWGTSHILSRDDETITFPVGEIIKEEQKDVKRRD